MKKFAALILCLMLAVCAASCFAEAASITGGVEDGAYVVRFPAPEGDEGQWAVEETASGEAVKLADSRYEDGYFTARWEAVSDGTATVSVMHVRNGLADEIHTFDLAVSGGKITEATGGSYAAAPDHWELDSVVPGEWWEKDTQFTIMDIDDGPDDSWSVRISSPMTHGAFVLEATLRYDLKADGLVYSDGRRFELTADGTAAEPSAENLSGTVILSGAEDSLELVWTRDDGGDPVSFTRADPLPAYTYTGSDPVEEAVINWLLADGRPEGYRTEEGYVCIPAPVILKVDQPDDTHAVVYGNFWTMNYVRRGSVLFNISGGEAPGIASLEKQGDGWTVTSAETAGDGDDYIKDITRFAAGDDELLNLYLDSGDQLESVRTRLIRGYVEANSLNITAWQDYGWPEVPLE